MSAAKSWFHLLQICAVKCGLLHHPTNHLHVTICAAMCPSPTPPQKGNQSRNPSLLPIEQKWQIQIMIVLVFILSRYWFKSIICALDEEIIYFLKVGAHRVPTSPKGIRGPEGARIKRKLRKWNRAKYVEPSEICGTERNMCVHLHAYMPAPKGQ